MSAFKLASLGCFSVAVLVHSPFICWSGEILIELGRRPDPQCINIALGDTVKWSYLTNRSTGEIFLRDFGGRWESAPIGPGQSTSLTFTNPGLFAYHTSDFRSIGLPLGIGTIRVDSQPVTNSIALLAPVDGVKLLSPNESSPIRLFSIVRAPAEQVSRVDFFSGTNFLGSALEPYSLSVPQLNGGTHNLQARLVKTNGSIESSSAVQIEIIEGNYISSPFSLIRRLSGGQFLFYVIPAAPGHNSLYYSDILPQWRYLISANTSGLILDESTTNQTTRFYKITQDNPPF